ncbi:MAG TPA: radical SAM protein, partial [Epsilonproteobacteria bacterium]|nr:radical SAM protein [Campylobacterota bacterium]
MKKIIQDLTKEELANAIKPAFRAKQIYHWIYHQYVTSFDEMKNLPKDMRERLNEEYTVAPLKQVMVQNSKDGSRKYLYELHDGHTVEAVLLLMREKEYHKDGSVKHQERYTVCISSQVGCKVGCAFCLTAKGGFMRNLTAGEIVEQVRLIKKDNDIAANRRVNLVYMGMGEPLDNLPEVAKSVKIFAEEEGMAIATHRQTISTSGLSAKIERLGKMELGINLA